MKKLFLLLTIIVFGQAGFAQNKFQKRKTEVYSPQSIDKNVELIDRSKTQIVDADRSLILSQTSDNQTYMMIKAKRDGIKITRDENGMPAIIEGTPRNLKQGIKAGRSAAASAAYNYLDAVKPFLKLSNPDEEFALKDITTDDIEQTHVRLNQMHKGVLVYGAEVVLHSRGGKGDLLNGHFFPTPSIENVTPSLSEESIGKIALESAKKHSVVQTLSFAEMKMLKYQKPQAELIIYHKDEKADAEVLAYHVTVRPNFIERWEYIIDANSGEVLDKYNNTCAVDGPITANYSDLNGVRRSVGLYEYQKKVYFIDAQRKNPDGSSLFNPAGFQADDPQGVLWTINANGTTSSSLDVRQIVANDINSAWNITSVNTAVSAHYNAGVAFEYYKTNHKRKSLNGKGGTIISIVNIADDDGKGMDNAFWNGEFMGYGNGKTYFKPLAGGLDVAGHEMTHGVVQNSANLEYKGQSGAINESMADVFGAMIEYFNKPPTEKKIWQLGEDVVKSGYPSGALRDLSNPNQGGRSLNDDGFQPASMNQYYTGSEDNSGVHINSGIPNFAFYKIATASGMTKEIAEKIYYRTLTVYLTRTSKFIDLRRAVIQSATDLYGANGTAVNAAKTAFDAVGVVDPNSPNPNPTPNTNPTPTPTPKPSNDVPANTNKSGSYILSFDPKAKSLYVVDTVGESVNRYVLIAKNFEISHKPSVTDDGKTAYFVKADKNIYYIDLTAVKPYSPQEQILTQNKLSSVAEWDNVAISKDGKRLAAVSSKVDTLIYVFDLSGKTITSRKFKLYNPTYTKGVTTGQALYADAMEWDYDGENLVYDAFNKLKSEKGAFEFWDVGFINVWDNQKNTFGSGIIDKLITDLEKGENIGNPTFSKTSSNLMAFDYFYDDATADNYNSVIGINLDRPSDWQTVVENNTVGYPDFSRTDDFMLYNQDVSSGLNTNLVKLNSKDRRQGIQNTEKQIITASAYSVWYTFGTRKLPAKQEQSVIITKVNDKNPTDPAFGVSASASSGLSVILSILSGPATIVNNQISLTGQPGKVRVQAFQDGSSKFYPATKVDSFCVAPPKPTITSVTPKGDGFIFTTNITNGRTLWYANGVLQTAVSGEKSVNVTTTAPITIRTDIDGCLSAFSDAKVITPLANEPEFGSAIVLSPNPASDFIRINAPIGMKIESADLSNLSGIQLIDQKGDRSNVLEINVSKFQKGTYLLRIHTTDGIVNRKVSLD
jgi:bacillolysin